MLEKLLLCDLYFFFFFLLDERTWGGKESWLCPKRIILWEVQISPFQGGNQHDWQGVPSTVLGGFLHISVQPYFLHLWQCPFSTPVSSLILVPRAITDPFLRPCLMIRIEMQSQLPWGCDSVKRAHGWGWGGRRSTCLFSPSYCRAGGRWEHPFLVELGTPQIQPQVWSSNWYPSQPVYNSRASAGHLWLLVTSMVVSSFSVGWHK